MECCPTCNARYKGASACHRCGTPLSELIDIENRAADHREKAVEAFNQRNFQEMYFHGRRAASLFRTPYGEKLLACAALAAGDPQTALSAWTRLRR